MDARFAAWLQSALETWQIPKRLSQKLGYARIKPVFRDRSDLRAAASLSESLMEALENSSSMIVICSRHSAKSEWVGMEISRFRELHGDNRIFSIIVSDSPPECFPPELLRQVNGNALEPIAADARRGFDGRQDALLKTIAGLLDVEFDDLKRRDLRRQYRRMTMMATGAFAVAVVTLGLAIAAYDARNDANRRREQAEGLISFMLGDLRARLEPIGRLDVLNAVGDKSLEYFASLEGEELTPKALLGRAQALRQIGEVRMSQGNFDEALSAFQLSNKQARQLLDIGETPELVEFEMSQSHFWIGYVFYERKQIGQAREQFESYLELSRSLLTRHPDNNAYLTEVAYAHTNLGTLELKANNFEEAGNHYEETALIYRAQIAASPEDLIPKQGLAVTLSWLGEAESRSGELYPAVSWFSQEYKLRKLIVSLSEDMAQVENLADAAIRLGREEFLAGQLESATGHLDEAYKLGRQLVQHDPENVWWQQLHASRGIDRSQIAAARGDLPTATTLVDAAIAAIRGLPESTEFQAASRLKLTSQALAQKARVLRQSGDTRAREVVRMALADIDKFDLTDPKTAVVVAGLQLLDGDLAAETGDLAAAISAWSTGLATLEVLPDNLRELIGLMTRATLLERTNYAAQAAVLREEIAQLGFRDTEDGALSYALIGVP
jgi:tetratricopeptide (TPR) repeat protein